MTALADIKAVIDRKRAERAAVPLVGRFKTLVVEIGDSAAQAIVAETRWKLPNEIDGVPLIQTNEFRGFDVVER